MMPPDSVLPTAPPLDDDAALAKAVRTGRKKAVTVIERVEDRDAYPVSSAQRRLYAIQQTDGTGVAYDLTARLRSIELLAEHWSA